MKHSMFTAPAFVKTTLLFFLIFLTTMLLARLVMLGLVWPTLQEDAVSAQQIIKSLYIGTKFDARIAVFFSLPIGLILALTVKRDVPFIRHGLMTLYTVLFVSLICVYLIDFGYFFYIHQRLDSSFIDFLKDADIAFNMVWQSYPVLWILLGILILLAATARFFNKRLLHHKDLVQQDRLRPEVLLRCAYSTKKRTLLWACALILGLTLTAYGQVSAAFFPLRWSNAYFSSNNELVLLALNPIQNLYDTMHSMRVSQPNNTAAQHAYPEMARWLRVDAPHLQNMHFSRTVVPMPQTKQWNVVIILMESMGWPMTSFAHGKADPTPTMKHLADNGVLFTNFFAPARTTARAIFTVMTGIPDVNREGGTTSRNPRLVRQHLPINEFTDYSKYYLLGGSASWANIRGLLTHNVEDLELLEEGSWSSPNVDVWGLSDLDLFRESITVFNDAKKPFVSVIQTAGFHRPFTIPDDNAGFVSHEVSDLTLHNYGFSSLEEYNALRFSDHALGEFFRLARKEPWFENTIFVITGDHGLSNRPANMSPGYVACGLQSSHVPLILYAPGYIEQDEHHFLAGHPDIFPTAAALAGLPIKHQGLGRNLLDPTINHDARLFLAQNDENFRLLLENNYCYIYREQETLYNLETETLQNLLTEEPERAQSMRKKADDMYHTSKYMIFNNH